MTLKVEKEFARIDRRVGSRIIAKIKWLAEHADEIIHHQLTSLPEELKGLCRLRVGDWRVFYVIYHKEKCIVIYGIAHRSEAYRDLH